MHLPRLASCALALLVGLAGAARADGTPLGLGHAELWLGYDAVSDAKSALGQPAETHTLLWGGAQVTASALGALIVQHGPLRIGDLVGVTVGAGQNRTSGNAVAAGLFDARFGAQLLDAVTADVDVGLEGGVCSCGQFDQFSGGDARDILPFGGARVRWQRLTIGGGYLRGPYGSAGWDLGVARLAVMVVRPAAQTRYPADGTGDFFSASATLVRVSLGRDF